MNRLIFIFISVSIIGLTSCSKESPLTITPLEGMAERSLANNDATAAEHLASTAATDPLDQIAVEVTNSSLFPLTDEYRIDYSSDYDFSNDSLAATQYLEFVDAQGNTFIDSVSINSYSIDTESLEVIYELTEDELSGLQLSTTQHIIIEDVLIN